jgi:hypothetical protein
MLQLTSLTQSPSVIHILVVALKTTPTLRSCGAEMGEMVEMDSQGPRDLQAGMGLMDREESRGLGEGLALLDTLVGESPMSGGAEPPART